MPGTQEFAAERLMNDMRAVERDAEALLKATAGTNGENGAAVRELTESALRAVKERLAALSNGAVTRAKHAAEVTDHYVHTNPWQSVGIGAATGLLVGFLLGRR